MSHCARGAGDGVARGAGDGVVTLAEETGEGLFFNPLAFVLKFAPNYRD